MSYARLQIYTTQQKKNFTNQSFKIEVRSIYTYFDLVLAVFEHCLYLFQALQVSVHAFVETPRFVNRYVVQVEALLHVEEGLDCSLEHAGECNVKREASLFENLFFGVSRLILNLSCLEFQVSKIPEQP
jgi:hypothetical protein